jgi:uncharacterized membrane protein YdfJ with MMPL/SSD domain
MLERLGKGVAARPRTVIAVWVVLLLGSAVLASGLTKQLGNRGFGVPGSSSSLAAETAAEQIPAAGGSQLSVAATAATPAPARLAATLHRSAALLRADPAVLDVGAPRLAADGKAALLPFALRADSAKAQEEVPELRDSLTAGAPADLEIEVIGQAAVYKRYSDIAAEDLKRSETLSFPVPLVVLLIAFLSVVAALVPIVSGAVCVVIVFGAIYLISLATNMSIFVANVASVLGIGLSIDFALFSVTRYRELRDGPQPRGPAEAAAATVATSGRAIALSGLTVAASLALLLVVGVGIFSSIAIGAILTALIAAAVGLTFVPALLVVLGPRLERWKLRGASRRASDGQLWRRIGIWSTTHPVVATVGTVALLLFLAIPVTGLTITSGPTSELPSDDSVRQSIEAVETSFGPGTTAPVETVTPVAGAPAALRILRADPGIRALLGHESGGGWVRIDAVLGSPPDSTAAHDTVERLQTAAGRQRRPTYVGGQTAELNDLIARIEDRAPFVVLGILLVAALILGFGLRSLVVPLKAIITTTLSAAAGLGVVTFLFTDIGSHTGLGYFVPLVTFAIVFGLSIDYESFLMSRIREEVAAGRSNNEAVVEGVAHTGRSITLAGIVMVAVFAAFAAGRLAPFQELGIGLVVAVILDVTVVRLALVPGAMALMGRWNWWLPSRSPRPEPTAEREA